MRWVLAVVVGAVLFQGCVGALRGDADFVTAGTLQDDADDIALDWAGDARLVAVVGAEPNAHQVEARDDDAEPPPDDVDDDFSSLVAKADPDVGDGRAQAWAFGYASAERNETLIVGLAPNGTVLFQETEDGTSEGMPEHVVREWRVDSDEAVDVARDNHHAWANVSTTTNVSTFMFLFGTDPEHDPIWMLGIEGPDGGDGAIVFVNATDGRYLGELGMDIPGFEFNFTFEFPPPPEEGEFQGELTLLGATVDHAWTIEEPGHPELILVLGADVPTPGQTLVATVTGPAGELIAEIELTGPDDTSVEKVDMPTVGDYNVEIELTDGLAQRYWFGWCATGFELDFDFDLGPTSGRPSPCYHG